MNLSAIPSAATAPPSTPRSAGTMPAPSATLVGAPAAAGAVGTPTGGARTGGTASAGGGSAALTTTSPAGTQAQFLKLLTTQLQNQDPLSPMDNAQLTSQIAQINTVSGIATLNTSVEKLSNQFLQMQTLQGATLVGKNVVVPGNKLAVVDGQGEGGFELTGAADAVKVEIVAGSGKVLDTLDLGAQSSGVHRFEWPAGAQAAAQDLSFRVSATSGGTSLSPEPLMLDAVESVGTAGGALQLELQKSGSVEYAKVKGIN